MVEHSIAHVVPEVEDAVRPDRQEPRAVDHVGHALDDRLDQAMVLGGIVFQVGVLDDDDVAGGLGEAGPHGRPFAAVPLVQDDANVFAAVDRRQHVPRAVGAAVVDQDDLLGDGHLADAADDLDHRGLLVVDRDHHGNPQPLGQRVRPSSPSLTRFLFKNVLRVVGHLTPIVVVLPDNPILLHGTAEWHGGRTAFWMPGGERHNFAQIEQYHKRGAAVCRRLRRRPVHASPLQTVNRRPRRGAGTGSF